MANESVAGRFTLLEELGRGGMGVVWRARDEVLGREVAVKQIIEPAHLSAAAVAQARARMVREGRAAARLNHPNAVTVHDILEEEDGVYIVMELIQAVSLGELVRREGPLPHPRTAALGLQLLDALAAAHAAGIVHRDVKPGNVLVLPGDRVKLADFGVASLEGDNRLTGPGSLLGSPAYMAPEQARGHECTPASDLWSLGVTLYYALEGRDAFEAPAFSAIIAKILDGVPPRPANAGPLEDLLAGLLRKDPAQRPGTEDARHALAAGGDAPARTVVASWTGPPVPQGTGATFAVGAQPTPVPYPSTPAPYQFEARVKSGGIVAQTVSSVVWTVVVTFVVMAFVSSQSGPGEIGSVRGDGPSPLVTLVGLVGLVRLGYLVVSGIAAAARRNVLEVGPRGISFSLGRYAAGYGWDQVMEIGVVRRGLFRRRALMVRPLGGSPAGLDPLRPPRMSGTRGRSPWFERKTGWVGLCHLDELKADAMTVEYQVSAFAGPRWRAPR